ncbi:hypothetical protein DCS_00965 [Drechmeria coniospora]|uniref:Uncharacterized protein n=1 Tax=Drechmeria coniospora TaxID=98403 RepID=A0A151GRY6_DRECN|nr:hypothetical protein DCS_00965 [Drechmeria coniospora]KYK59831.1 hypothetical protein DCS_00965 [Drechmeria coniospora]
MSSSVKHQYMPSDKEEGEVKSSMEMPAPRRAVGAVAPGSSSNESVGSASSGGSPISPNLAGLSVDDLAQGNLIHRNPMVECKTPASHFQHALNTSASASMGDWLAMGLAPSRDALSRHALDFPAAERALHDGATDKHNSTPAALPLTFVENVSAKDADMCAWSVRVDGAVQYVKERGPGQLKMKAGLDFFISVRTQMILRSLTTGKAPSLELDWWTASTDSNQHAQHFHKLSLRAAETKNEVVRLLECGQTPHSMDVMQRMMRQCQELDEKIAGMLRELPTCFRWRTVGWEEFDGHRGYANAEVFPGRVDKYADMIVANTWNVMRCTRLMLASLMVRATAWLVWPADYHMSASYESSAKLSTELLADIVASVPYHLGWPAKNESVCGEAQLSSFARGEGAAEKGLACYLLLWPLAFIQGQDFLTSAQRAWIKGRLRHIGYKMGVRYAIMLSQLDVRAPSMLVQRDRLMSCRSNGFDDVGQFVRSQEMASQIPFDTCIDGGDWQEVTRGMRRNRQLEELRRRVVEVPGAVDEATVNLWLEL